jgi:hypothetical protein
MTTVGTLTTVFKFDTAYKLDASIYSSGGTFMFKY